MEIHTQFTPELQSLWSDALSQSAVSWPFLRYEWHAAWRQTLGVREKLMLCVDTDTHAIVPLAIYDGVAHFTGGDETSDYLDAIGSDEAKHAMWPQVIELLKSNHVSSLRLRNIDQDSATLRFFQSRADSLIEEEDTTPIATLAPTFDEYLASLDRKNRHELKRKIRKFEGAHEGLSVTATTGRETDIPLLLSLMRRDTQKLDFLTEAMEQFFLQLPETMTDSLTQLTLRMDTLPLATTLAFRTQNSLLLYNSGYNDDYVGAGFYLKAKTIEWAIAQKLTSYNFLQGNERYKYELGGTDHFVYRVSTTL